MKRRILVIENNGTLLRAYYQWLSKLGYEVQPADTIPMASVHLDNQRCHAVIFDIDAAGARGLDFLREYWLQFKIDGTQVAVISQGVQLQDDCESMGIPFFRKPARMTELEQIVVRLVYGDAQPIQTRPLPALQF